MSTNASLVAVGKGVDVSVGTDATTKGPNAVGVCEGTITATVAEGRPPGGVGVKYSPHKDALPTQEAVSKETAINRAGIRFTIGPLRELYLC